MEIVHVSVGALPPVFSDDGGAIQRRVAELARIQRRRGHTVRVISPGERRQKRSIDEVPVTYLKSRVSPPLSHIEFQSRALVDLSTTRSKPDVIHFHSEPEAGFMSARFAAARVLSYDNYYFRRGRASRAFGLYKRALRAFDLLLPCSEYCAHESAKYWQMQRPRMEVLYNGVNPAQFRPDPDGATRERRRLELDGPVVLYLGRLCAQKGTPVLLSAWERIVRKRPDAQLVLAGPCEQFSNTLSDTAKVTWQRRVQAAGGHYIGTVAEGRLSGLLSLAEVFVMPTVELEMFGMAAVEAQACGVPVVASDHGGLRETVPDGCGVRVTPGDPTSLADGILRLLADTSLRRATATAALANARRFAWARIADDLDERYQQAVWWRSRR